MSGGADRDERRAGRVLVLGVYLVDRPNLAAEISVELGSSTRWRVEQRWVALGRSPVPSALAPVTTWTSIQPTPKFELVNRLLRDAAPGGFDYVVVSDDDIALPAGFLDAYLALVEQHDLALAQPARTHDSYIDHRFVEQLDGLDARWTRFVEIGPLFSIRRDALARLAPFDPGSPMGWGYDFVWPVVMEEAGLHMGIVDATPVSHSLRKPVANYDYATANQSMKAYLAAHPHLTRDRAFTIVRAFAGSRP
jgi:hypothetical protein